MNKMEFLATWHISSDFDWLNVDHHQNCRFLPNQMFGHRNIEYNHQELSCHNYNHIVWSEIKMQLAFKYFMTSKIGETLIVQDLVTVEVPPPKLKPRSLHISEASTNTKKEKIWFDFRSNILSNKLLTMLPRIGSTNSWRCSISRCSHSKHISLTLTLVIKQLRIDFLDTFGCFRNEKFRCDNLDLLIN